MAWTQNENGDWVNDGQGDQNTPAPDNPQYVAPVTAGQDQTASPDLGALAAQYAQYGEGQQSLHQAPTYQTGQMADPSSPAYDPSMSGTNGIQSAPEAGVFSKLLQGMGIQNKSGEIDYSDPQVLDKIINAVSIGGKILTSLQGPQNKKSASELQAQFKSPFDNFTPASQKSADAYFNGPYVRHTQQAANTMSSPIVAGQRYAEGGGVENEQAHQGALSLIRGSDSGQADTVKANLSHGEYVFDADTVAALGDGNNEAGAKMLDKWREELRREKRSAPVNQIPPKAKAPMHYLGKVK